MSARARNRARPRDTTAAGEQRRRILLALGVALGAFLVGYGLTALAFQRATPPGSVVSVPDLRDLPEAQARRTAVQHRLGVEIGDSLPNAVTPAGAVLAQSPLPGQEVSVGSNIRLIMSTGRPQPRVPDVEAMPVALATRALQALGFDVLIDSISSELPPGRVAEVSPAIGTPLPLPGTVRLGISTGPPLVPVPFLVGMGEQHAREAVETAGLRLGRVAYEAIEDGADGYVVGQRPVAGDSLPAGSEVSLRVTRPRSAMPLVDLLGEPIDDAGSR